MGVSLSIRKLVVPVTLPSCTANTSLGLTVVPSGMVKFHRHDPSRGCGALADGSSAAGTRTAPMTANAKSRTISLSSAFINPAPLSLRHRFRRRRAKLQPNLFFIFVITAAIGNVNPVAFVLHEPQAKPALAVLVPYPITALAVRSSLNRRFPVQRRGAHHRQRRAAIGGVITVTAVISREHVRVPVQDADATDVIRFDKIGNLAPFCGEHAPMILVVKTAPSPKAIAIGPCV